jgi:hypothetical protein
MSQSEIMRTKMDSQQRKQGNLKERPEGKKDRLLFCQKRKGYSKDIRPEDKKRQLR